MNKTNIAWTDFTWNPVTGCTQCSEGCVNCYAKAVAKRFNGKKGEYMGIDESGEAMISVVDNDDYFKVALQPDRLDQPLKRKKPAKIFVCSMSDLFHEDVPDDFIRDVLITIKQSPQHTFMILTKRALRMQIFFEDYYAHGGMYEDPIRNLWLGVTAENQARADERIPLLLQTPAAKRFVSIEPMLELIGIQEFTPSDIMCARCGWVPLEGMKTYLNIQGNTASCVRCGTSLPANSLDWVIAGGESGPGARECREEWIRSIWEECQDSQIPFFFKQCGNKWDRCLQLPCIGEDVCEKKICTMGTGQDWEQRREWPAC